MVQLLLPIIYISFISLGLPDSLLGSAWPSMYPVLGVPVSYAGLISMIISFGTIVSSLNSDRLTRALGTGKVTVLSVAMTAAALIPVMYPAFADPRIVSAVRWHTTGRVGMTLDEKLIYLADYIDDSRTFPDCVTLRNLFWDAHPEQMEMPARLAHLRTVLIVSYDMTITGLIRDGVPVSPDTFLARNELLCEQNGL